MLMTSAETVCQPQPLQSFPSALNFRASSHVLDTPVTAAFAGHWSGFAERHGTARCLPSDIGSFACLGGEETRDRDDFVHMTKRRQAPVILLQRDEIKPPKRLEIISARKGVQMVPTAPIKDMTDFDVAELGDRDAAEMLALARLTKPGPFEINTHRLGSFIGFRIGGVLAAMTGRRMAFPGWIEISGVAVHPDFRGKALARLLVSRMVARIKHTGAMPFLHTYEENEPAIALYESMGFEIRCKMNIAVVV